MGKKPVAPGGDNGPNTIFKATYSGVPVYEMICRDVAVMRRRSDAYLNATQILKVAGFDKPQRTRVLEREVQKGEHEKVQGGYGKYQGTWIPIERGLALSKQYGVEDLLRPIIDYVPTSVSPPPAPKHAVAPPTKSKKDKEAKAAAKEGLATPSKTGPMSAAALAAKAQLSASASTARASRPRIPDSTPDVDTSMRSQDQDNDESFSATPEDNASSSDTPSPVASLTGDADLDADGEQEIHNAGLSGHTMDVDGMTMHLGMGMPMGIPMEHPGSSSRKRNAAAMMEEDDQYAHLRQARGNSAVHTPSGSPRHLGMGMGDELMGPEQYTDIILNYFVSETTQIPQILVSPPHDYDANSRIDDDGHTALHWACAMGRVRVVKLLLTANASIFAGNNAEQTPLMRSVMFSNNYDVRKFPELYELLHRSTLNIDKQNRTVFHHIANLALAKGKTHAAKYYMETILSRLADYPQELADVINFQDEEGETALTIAARARSRRLVKALLDHGADPKIKNRDFKSAEDYILEDERFRSSPVQTQSQSNGVFNNSSRIPTSSANANANANAAGLGGGGSGSTDKIIFAPQLYNSEAARLAGGSCLQDISSHMTSLARSFDSELQGKERDILQAKAMLTNIHSEVTEASKTITSLNEKVGPGPIEDKKRELQNLQNDLSKTLKNELKKGYDRWLKGQLKREEEWSNGELAEEDLEDLNFIPVGGNEVVQAEEERLRWEIEEKGKGRNDLVQKLVKAKTEAGTSAQIAKYKRLIAAACEGNVNVSEVDGMINQLLETLESENEQASYLTTANNWIA